MTSPCTESHTEWGWGAGLKGLRAGGGGRRTNGIFSRSLIIQLVLTWGN